MCEFSAKLVAWMDGELPEDEMTAHRSRGAMSAGARQRHSGT
jgi:hypothetical protein